MIRLGLIFGALFASSALGMIHHLKLSKDERPLFIIEMFGFESGGKVDLDVRKYQLYSNQEAVSAVGIAILKAKSESSVVEAMDKVDEEGLCILENPTDSTTIVHFEKSKMKDSFTVVEPGFYALIFQRCLPEKGSIDLDVQISLYNKGPNYLSVGEQPLPWMYIVMSFFFMGAGGLWFYWIRSHQEQTHMIHNLFTALLFVKVLSVLFEAFNYLSIRTNGHGTGFNVVFYIFALIKALLLFAIILLVGAGWTLLKPLLSDREKRLFAVVVPLQVLAQIGIIVVDEIAPGSKAYNAWRVILHVADLACCLLVLLPVIWSIRHLTAAAGADGKARDTVNRLQMFRTFYLSTVLYIYFTRVIVYILRATLAYNVTWVADFFDEIAALIFYLATGYLFRPGAENPYLRIPNEDEDDEFGLEDGDEVDTSNARRPQREADIEMSNIDADDVTSSGGAAAAAANDNNSATGAAATQLSPQDAEPPKPSRPGVVIKAKTAAHSE